MRLFLITRLKITGSRHFLTNMCNSENDTGCDQSDSMLNVATKGSWGSKDPLHVQNRRV